MPRSRRASKLIQDSELSVLGISDILRSELRLKVIKLLHEEGPLRFSEILKKLGLDGKDKGKLSYHLKRLQQADIVVKGRDNLYYLTRLGERIYSHYMGLASIECGNKGHWGKIIDNILTSFNISESKRRTIKSEVLNELNRLHRRCGRDLLAGEIYVVTIYSLLKRGVCVNTILVNANEIKRELECSQTPYTDIGKIVLSRYSLSELCLRRLPEACGKIVKTLIEHNMITIPALHLFPRGMYAIVHTPRSLLHFKGRMLYMMKDIRDKRYSMRKILYKIFSSLESFSELSRYQIITHFNVWLAPFVKDSRDIETIRSFIYELSLNPHLSRSVIILLDVDPSSRIIDMVCEEFDVSEEHIREFSSKILEVMVTEYSFKGDQAPLINPQIGLVVSNPDELKSRISHIAKTHIPFIMQEIDARYEPVCDGDGFYISVKSGMSERLCITAKLTVNIPSLMSAFSDIDTLIDRLPELLENILDILKIKNDDILTRAEAGHYGFLQYNNSITPYINKALLVSNINIMGLFSFTDYDSGDIEKRLVKIEKVLSSLIKSEERLVGHIKVSALITEEDLATLIRTQRNIPLSLLSDIKLDVKNIIRLARNLQNKLSISLPLNIRLNPEVCYQGYENVNKSIVEYVSNNMVKHFQASYDLTLCLRCNKINIGMYNYCPTCYDGNLIQHLIRVSMLYREVNILKNHNIFKYLKETRKDYIISYGE